MFTTTTLSNKPETLDVSKGPLEFERMQNGDSYSCGNESASTPLHRPSSTRFLFSNLHSSPTFSPIVKPSPSTTTTKSLYQRRHKKRSQVVSGCLYVRRPKGARIGTSSSSEIGKRTTADRTFYYESLPPTTPKRRRTIVESDTAADDVDFPPSGDDGDTDSDIIAEESAPSSSVWHLRWKDELTAVSEYCIESEPSTTCPALPSTGVQAPPILKSSGRNSVVDRVGLIHERRLVDFFSIFENYLRITETEEDQAYWLNRTVKSLFRTPAEATTLKCDLLHFKPMLPFLYENDLPYIFSRLDGEDEGGEGSYWKLEDISRDDKEVIAPVRRSCRLARAQRVNYAK